MGLSWSLGRSLQRRKEYLNRRAYGLYTRSLLVPFAWIHRGGLGFDGLRVRDKCPLTSENGGYDTKPLGLSGGHLSDAIFAQSRHRRSDVR